MSSTDPFSVAAEPGRRITEGEIKLLQPVFRDTLPYSRILCYTMAGARSITPTGNPYFARSIYFDDFSKIPSAHPNRNRALWNFVHELTHVWQYYHSFYNVRFGLVMLLPAALLAGYLVAEAMDLVARLGRRWQPFGIAKERSS